MNYTEHDADAPAVDWRESADEAAAQAQIDSDQQAAQDAAPAPF